jgi:hypothetical protein
MVIGFKIFHRVAAFQYDGFRRMLAGYVFKPVYHYIEILFAQWHHLPIQVPMASGRRCFHSLPEQHRGRFWRYSKRRTAVCLAIAGRYRSLWRVAQNPYQKINYDAVCRGSFYSYRYKTTSWMATWCGYPNIFRCNCGGVYLTGAGRYVHNRHRLLQNRLYNRLAWFGRCLPVYR